MLWLSVPAANRSTSPENDLTGGISTACWFFCHPPVLLSDVNGRRKSFSIEPILDVIPDVGAGFRSAGLGSRLFLGALLRGPLSWPPFGFLRRGAARNYSSTSLHPCGSAAFLRAGAAVCSLLALKISTSSSADFFAMVVLPMGCRFTEDQISGCATDRSQYATCGRLLRSRMPSGFGPPVAQSISSTVWTTGIAVPAAICVMQPTLPAAITSAPKLLDIPDFALAQPLRDVRLQNVVGPRRAAAQMSFRHIFDHEAQLGKQFLRLACDFLTVLQRAGGMIGDRDPQVPRLGTGFSAARYSDMSWASWRPRGLAG